MVFSFGRNMKKKGGYSAKDDQVYFVFIIFVSLNKKKKEYETTEER